MTQDEGPTHDGGRTRPERRTRNEGPAEDERRTGGDRRTQGGGVGDRIIGRGESGADVESDPDWFEADMAHDRRVEAKLLWKELLVWILVGLVALARVYWVG